MSNFISPSGDFSSFDKQAIVDETILPFRKGRVSFQGSWWNARCQQNIIIKPGEVVEVVGIHNITLIVEPILQGCSFFLNHDS